MKRLLLAVFPICGLSFADVPQQNIIAVNVCNSTSYDMGAYATASYVPPLGQTKIFTVSINSITVANTSTIISVIDAFGCKVLNIVADDYVNYPPSLTLNFLNTQKPYSFFININNLRTTTINGTSVNTAYFNYKIVSPVLTILKYNNGLDNKISAAYTGGSAPNFNYYVQSEKFVNPSSPYDYELTIYDDH
jgi:hypothetical protein